MLKKIICIVILCLAFLTPAHAQQSLTLGGGNLSPNSDKNDESLSNGWGLVAAMDHRF